MKKSRDAVDLAKAMLQEHAENIGRIIVIWPDGDGVTDYDPGSKGDALDLIESLAQLGQRAEE